MEDEMTWANFFCSSVGRYSHLIAGKPPSSLMIEAQCEVRVTIPTGTPPGARTHAVVSATHGADTELLPLLTTHAESLLAAAKVVVRDRITPYDVLLSPVQLDAGIDMIVRVVLSHVMQPSAGPARTADDIAWVAARVLRG